ncbi:MAG: hypothetical protein Q8O33_13350, partial [Pseudomonadota bacterium]|nr:hypothetical protein [Pseudomonadota bacterium]
GITRKQGMKNTCTRYRYVLYGENMGAVKPGLRPVGEVSGLASRKACRELLRSDCETAGIEALRRMW